MPGYTVYSNFGPVLNASFYYRILKPINMMDAMGLPIDALIDNNDATVPFHQRTAAFLESDFTLLYQSMGDQRLNMVKQARVWKPMQAGYDQMRWPPTFIADTDDDLFNVPPLNITFRQNGIKRPDGTPMETGDEIGIGHPVDIPEPAIQEKLNKRLVGALPGEKIQLTTGGIKYIMCADGLWHLYIKLWKDGDNMDLAANKHHMDTWREVLRNVHLVTCSTPRAEAYVKREVPEANTFVTWNAIDFGEYERVDLAPHPDKVRILWQGSATHHEDLWPLNTVIGEVAQKYPQTEWVFWGAPYKWASKNIPPDQLWFIPWSAYEAYKIRLSTIGHDINLCPLTPHIFNQSRSAIKWYESSAIWHPAATLAQNTGAYGDEIEEGKTGLLFETPAQFKEQLSRLIEDELLRKELASNAKDWVRSNREARTVYKRLFDKWMETRETQKATAEYVNAEPTTVN